MLSMHIIIIAEHAQKCTAVFFVRTARGCLPKRGHRTIAPAAAAAVGH
jgi:hypothetical protein